MDAITRKRRFLQEEKRDCELGSLQTPVKSAYPHRGGLGRIGKHVTLLHRRRIARQSPGGPGRRLSRRRGTQRGADRRRVAPPPGGIRPRRPAADRADHVEILSGVWRGQTIGSPIALLVPNKDYKIEQMEDLASSSAGTRRPERLDQVPRLDPRRVGAGQRPETAARVAAGALAKQLLDAASASPSSATWSRSGRSRFAPSPARSTQQRALRDQSELYTLNPDQDAEIKALIDAGARSRATRWAA